jgi:SAM-dependent methyltransferase
MSSKTQIIPLVTSSIPSYNVSSLLDCACGVGKWAGVLRTHLPQMAHSYIVGLDIYRGNLEFTQKYGAYDDLVLADIQHLPFKNDCFQVCLAAEVIEHVQKKDGQTFLEELERISAGRVVVTTPNGSWPDHSTEYADGQVNIHEHHTSMWHVNDFTKIGYNVHAIGLRIRPSSKSYLLFQIIGGLDFLLFPGWILPQLGKHLVAYKDSIE